MRIPVALAVLLTATLVQADRDVDETLEVAADSLIEIANVRGDIKITGWDRAEVRVEGDLDDLAETLVFERSGNKVTVTVKMPGKVNWGDGSDLEISVPVGSRVDFSGVSTDVKVRNVAGGLRMRSVSGDVEAEEIAGSLIISTVSGSVDLNDIDGDTQVKTMSGEIDMEAMSQNVVLDTVSGEIDVELRSFTSLRASAVSGDVEMEGQLADQGRIHMNTVNGDLRLALAEPVDAEITVEAGPGGDITNRLNDTRPVERNSASTRLDTVVGTGAGRISLRTVSGDIKLQSGR